MKGRAHDLLDHVESGQRGGVYHKKPVSLCEESDFSFFWRFFTFHSIAGKRVTQDQSGLIFVNFVLFEIEDIEVIFSQTLEMTDVPVAYGVIFPEGGAFEFTGAYFRYIVSELGAHSVLDFDFFDQQKSPLSEEHQGSKVVIVSWPFSGKGFPRSSEGSLFSL
jgi:hypothetical protein